MVVLGNTAWDMLFKEDLNFNEISYKLMEHVHAIVHDVPYNYSHYLMRYFIGNIDSSRPFLMYPRLLMKVISSKLDFGGVPV
ncbi:hypothetical protein Hanom_Chr06g00523721 [Helianthus anomalus]